MFRILKSNSRLSALRDDTAHLGCGDGSEGKILSNGGYSGIACSKGEGPTAFRAKGKLGPRWSDVRKIGDWVSIGANGSEIEVVLGEGRGGAFGAELCVEEEGVTYSGEQRPLFKIVMSARGVKRKTREPLACGNRRKKLEQFAHLRLQNKRRTTNLHGC
jgi:hypothetical protein